MQNILDAFNYELLLFYGMALSGMFAGIRRDRRNKLGFLLLFAALTALQLAMYLYLRDFDLLEKIYPLMIHVPLTLFLVWFCKKSWFTAVSAVLSAYLFTTPRRWLAGLVVYFFSGTRMAAGIAEAAVTLVLLWVVCRYYAASVLSIINRPDRTPHLFSAFLMIYYLFNNVTVIFTDALYSGNPIVTDALAACMVLCFFTFNVFYYREIQRRQWAESLQSSMEKSIGQAKAYIERLHENEKQMRMYRHDMRHHLSLIGELAVCGHTDRLLEYLNTVSGNLTRFEQAAYCRNETANLILNAFAGRAREADVKISISAALPAVLPVDDTALCALLSNGFENAVTAAAQVAQDGGDGYVRIECGMAEQKLLVLIQNSYCGERYFRDGLPTRAQGGHGVGAASISAIVRRHGGLCEFSACDGVFTLRIAL